MPCLLAARGLLKRRVAPIWTRRPRPRKPTLAEDRFCMADKPERADILAVLETVKDPKTGLGLVSAGLVQGLVAGPGRVGFMMEVLAADAELYQPVAEAAEAA